MSAPGRRPRIRLAAARLFLRDCRTRQPFRFGVHTLTVAPLALLRAEVDVEDRGRVAGYSSDLLVPKWFEKDETKTPRQDVLALVASAEGAIDAAAGLDPAPAFEAWDAIYRSRMRESTAPALLAGFGVALVERAMLDALCRAEGVSFFDAILRDLVGFEPGRVDPATAGWSAARLAPKPADSLILRHTVGLLDPLVEGDLEALEHGKPDDGFPRTLKSAVERDRLRHFKIKLQGDPDADAMRLLAIGRVLSRSAPPDFQFTLDGNEQFKTIDGLADVLDTLARRPVGKALLSRLLYVEQPLPRALTFDPAANRGISRLDRFGGAIIDEADGTPDAFARARAIGYRGVSVKNCKGVFRALVHRAAIDIATTGGGFQSGEDLTNLPVVALQQDLATAALLHLPSVERNGHHYFRGLDHLHPDVRKAAVASHPDLYQPHGDSAGLCIRDGRLMLRSLRCAGYGTAIAGLEAGFVPLEDWRLPEDLV